MDASNPKIGDTFKGRDYNGMEYLWRVETEVAKDCFGKAFVWALRTHLAHSAKPLPSDKRRQAVWHLENLPK